MSYFNNSYIQFFSDLEKNNSKTWFDENRKRYENDVKLPFNHFITDLIAKVQDFDPEIDIQTKNALFRINRDIRFSKDKTPYNTIMKAGIVKGGRKSMDPGYYIGIDAHHIGIGGGLYMVDKDKLDKIRMRIAAKSENFLSILSAKNFKSDFSELHGERIKRIPTDLKEAAEKTNYVLNKQWYCMASYSDKSLITSENLLPFVLEKYHAIYPLILFFREALRVS